MANTESKFKGKDELIAQFSDRTNLTKKDCRFVIDEFVAMVVENIFDEGGCKVPGLGVFEVKEIPAGMVRNPSTKENFYYEGGEKLKFDISPSLKNSVKNRNKVTDEE